MATARLSHTGDLGRFLSPDSIVPGAGDPQALNRYAYVRNNPLRYTDPTGHCIPDYVGFRGCGLERGYAATCGMSTLCQETLLDYSFEQEYSSVFGPFAAGGFDTGLMMLAASGPEGLGIHTEWWMLPTRWPKISRPVAVPRDGIAEAESRGLLKTGAGADAGVTGPSRTFQTYTKTNRSTGQVYVGRTSGYGTPLENISRRDAACVQ
jgi:hypothetical protein